MADYYEEYYETDTFGNEVYAKVLTGDEFFAKDLNTGDPKYAVDNSNNQTYPHMNDGKEIVAKTSTSFKYAEKASGKEFYPKTESGDEYAEDLINLILDPFGIIKYPLDNKGTPFYPRDPLTNWEFYREDSTGTPIIGTDENGNQVYAKTSSGNEFYPKGDGIALDRNKVPTYAVSKTFKVIYKRDVDGNEYYFKDPKTFNDIVKNHEKPLDRYAKDRYGGEIYPYEIMDPITEDNRQILIGDMYAKTQLGTVMYPLDEYGNEYTIIPEENVPDEEKYYPIGYPITNDNKIIVPGIGENLVAYFSETLEPSIKEEDIVGKLKTSNNKYTNYITNVTAPRISRGLKKEYFTQPLKLPLPAPNLSFRQTNWSLGLLIATLVLIALIFMYRFLFAKMIQK